MIRLGTGRLIRSTHPVAGKDASSRRKSGRRGKCERVGVLVRAGWWQGDRHLGASASAAARGATARGVAGEVVVDEHVNGSPSPERDTRDVLEPVSEGIAMASGGR